MNSSKLSLIALFLGIISAFNAQAEPVDPQRYKEVNLLIKAIEEGNKEVFNFLIRNQAANLDEPDDEGRTALMMAAEAGNLEFVKALIEAGAGLNARDRYGDTALRLATRAEHNSIIDELLESDADPYPGIDLTDESPLEADAVPSEYIEPDPTRKRDWSRCKMIGGAMLCGAALAAALKYGMSKN